MITGKYLIALGFKPGKWFAEAIDHINSNNLEGDALASYLNIVKPPDALSLQPSVPFHENIVANNELEQQNIDAVKRSMVELMKTPTIISGAIMPDACVAGPNGTIPVGGVAVATGAIHPGFHSADICCSMFLTNIGKVDPKTVLDMAQQVTHFGPGGRGAGNPFSLPSDILNEIKENPFLNSERSVKLAKEHLGTQGASNHFLYVGISKSTGDTIIVTHHGSRGVGALLYKNGMRVSERFRKELSPETLSHNAWIPYSTDEGKNYWNALQTIRKWTKQNHSSIHDKICEVLKLNIRDRYWNEHNFVFKENNIFFHAKGATPMDSKFLPDITGPRIIPLNMAEPILIAKGGTTENNLGFAPHGAGRNFSRSKHKYLNKHRTAQEIFAEETKNIDARFFFNHIDISELPSAYKNAEEVKRQISKFKLADIIDEIQPYGCIMAGDWECDMPWKKINAKN